MAGYSECEQLIAQHDTPVIVVYVKYVTFTYRSVIF
jgi:hypothetical protein